MTTQAPFVTFYVVQSGDNLTKIAGMYQTTVDKLVQWNDIPDRNVIRTGQRLIVDKSDAPHDTIYTVRKGDTLFAIAQKYETTVDALVKWNHIPNPDVIQIGQRLIVARSQPLASASM